ncbi:ParM/StbA family protein [Paenibacillus hunanensis]|uniref:ParM/StbA family protein n=1 Tax=Paenibacillus hunanensis TaxID=539262 RepID=UPI002026D05D|nr:ParM/StbA family protein [Paenibacillus hunanensis]MCL9662148.1 ParM/StbA family protein [Paenibacillus hunanensis]
MNSTVSPGFVMTKDVRPAQHAHVKHPLNIHKDYFIVSIDFGYGYIKAVNERGERIIFRAMAAPAHERDIQQWGGAAEQKQVGMPIVEHSIMDDLHVTITCGEGAGQTVEELFVGQLALQSKDAAFTLSKDKIDHPNTRAFLGTALSYLTQGNTKPICVVTTLPYDYYDEQKEKFAAYLHRLQLQVQHHSNKYKYIHTLCEIDRALIYKQGSVCMFSYLMDLNLKPKRPTLMKSGYKIAIVNMGYHTVDVTTFSPLATGIEIDKNLSFTLDENVGMYELRKSAELSFYEQTGTHLALQRIENILSNKNGKERFKNQEIDIMPAFEAEKKPLVQRLMQQLDSRFGAEKDFLYSVVFSGGGAIDCKSYLESYHHNVEFSENGQYDDAIGALIKAKLELVMENRK